MIKVKRNQKEDSNQKVIGIFLKRVKKSNLVSRVRKSKFAPKKPSQGQKRAAALRRIQKEQEKEMSSKFDKL